MLPVSSTSDRRSFAALFLQNIGRSQNGSELCLLYSLSVLRHRHKDRNPKFFHIHISDADNIYAKVIPDQELHELLQLDVGQSLYYALQDGRDDHTSNLTSSELATIVPENLRKVVETSKCAKVGCIVDWVTLEGNTCGPKASCSFLIDYPKLLTNLVKLENNKLGSIVDESTEVHVDLVKVKTICDSVQYRWGKRILEEELLNAFWEAAETILVTKGRK